MRGLLGRHDLTMSDFYLLAAERACSVDTMVRDLYRNPDSEVFDRFLRYNGIESPSARLMPGELLIIPSLVAGQQLEPERVGRSVRRANYMMRNSKAEPAAETFNENFTWLRGVLGSEEFRAGAGITENTLDYFGRRADRIADMFGEYRRSYEAAARTPGKSFIKHSAANSARHFIESDLRQQITGISRDIFLPNPNRTHVQDQLGISHKALKNQIRTGRNLKELDKISDTAAKVQKLSEQLKRGAYVMKIVSAGSTVIEVNSVYANSGTRAGNMKVGREVSKFAGSAIGGRLGGAAGGFVAGGALVAFGIGTGGLGPAAIAIGGIVVGSVMGGAIGGEVGDSVWDTWGNGIYTAGEDYFDIFDKASLE